MHSTISSMRDEMGSSGGKESAGTLSTRRAAVDASGLGAGFMRGFPLALP